MRAQIIVLFTLAAGTAQADIVDEKQLTRAALSLPGTTLDEPAAQLLASTVIALAGTDLNPYLLIAQAFTESRFDPTWVSHVVAGKRRTLRWASRKPPKRWSGNLYCGIAQTQATTWAACLALRDSTVAAIAAQTTELRWWLKTTRGGVSKALAGYGCGFAGWEHGCRKYPQRVRALARRLERLARPVARVTPTS